MPQLYKIDYRRYGVQLPIPLADEVDRIAKSDTRSASQVIVEQLQRALYGYGLCSNEEMAELRDDQMTLLRSVPLAMGVLYGDRAKREEMAMQLAEMITKATTRKPTELVAESGADALPSSPAKTTQPFNGPKERPPDNSRRTAGAGPRHRVSKSA